MLSLSCSARSARNRYACTVISALDSFEATGLAASPDLDAAAFKRYLFARLRQPHSQTAKDAQRILALHRRGLTVVLRLHADADHGDVLLAALRWLDAVTPASAPVATAARPVPALTHSAAVSEIEDGAEGDLDPRRFVWILAADGSLARLGYVWDADGVITALVPGFGLVKMGRIRRQRKRRSAGRWAPVPVGVSFWQALGEGPDLTPRCRAARVILGGRLERVFAALVRRQQAHETIVTEERTRPDPERYNPWLFEPDPVDEELADAEERAAAAVVEADTQAYLRLHAPAQSVRWIDLLPSAYRGAHVRPVVKAKPDGTRWILTPQAQASGSLAAFRRVA